MKGRYLLFGIVAVALLAGAWMWQRSSSTLIAEAAYQCDNGRTISAAYYEGPPAPAPQRGEPPVPTGSVEVSLDAGPAVKLMQTISASGIRYANADESFVFWSKGKEALVMRGNEMDLEYTNCSAD